ncbi:acyltransferase [soil metagenome]
MTSSVERSNNFDGVRLIAAAMVLVSHQYALTGRSEPTFHGVQTLGGVGLLMFFSMSGYLVSQSWLRSERLGKFLTSRFLRIWPALAVVTLLEMFVLGPTVSSLDAATYFADSRTWRFLSNLCFSIRYDLPGVFVGNPHPNAVNGSTWSIPVEVKCYLVLAGAGLLGILRRRVLTTLAAALIVAHVFYARQVGAALTPLAEFGAFFALGALINVLGFVESRWKWIIGSVALAASVVLVFLDEPYAALFVAGPLLTVWLGSSCAPVLRRCGRYGDFSYGVYLYAFPVQQTIVQVAGVDLPFWQGLATAALVTSGLAAASWHLVERTALRFKPIGTRVRAPLARA